MSRSPNGRVAVRLGAAVAVMLALSFAAVPLYSLFCKVTGYGGTTSTASAPTGPGLSETVLVRFDANVAPGQASFNVAPFSAGTYFDKIACFCFESQVLQPGERVDMPVSFFVDPAMLEDFEAKDVRQITLSYTMFPAEVPPPLETAAADPATLGTATDPSGPLTAPRALEN
jgi:cytochrome c oxidase assembly protein subunit 11